MLMGAMLGAGTSLATGKSPLKGAIIGGLGGGLFGGSTGFGSGFGETFDGLSGLFQPVTEAAKTGLVEGASQGIGNEMLKSSMQSQYLDPTTFNTDAFNLIGDNPYDLTSGKMDLLSEYSPSDINLGLDGSLPDYGLVQGGYEGFEPGIGFKLSDIGNPLGGATPSIVPQAKPVGLFDDYMGDLGSLVQVNEDTGKVGVPNLDYMTGNVKPPSMMDRVSEIGTSAMDWVKDNPDKALMGGLAVGSILEPSPQEQIATAARGAGINPANLQGLITPAQVKPIVTAVIPRSKRQYRIG